VLIFLAPPETELEEKKIWLGNTSSVLSKAGREAAIDFARNDMWMKPSRVFGAPAEHIIEFSSIILPFFTPTIVEEFTDRSMGSLTGRGYRETMLEFPRRNWLAWQRSFWNAPPQGESLFDISDRVITAFQVKVLPISITETVLIICAPDIMRILLGFLTKTEETELHKMNIEPIVPYVVNGIIEGFPGK
jgi:2,3-bisphosphoglycerate-dependent phosphoglycerate mutase